MLYNKFRGYDPDTDVAAVEQGRALPLSEVIETGVVPPSVSEGEYVELDPSKGLSRPADVFDSIEMHNALRNSANAKASETAAASTSESSTTQNG